MTFIAVVLLALSAFVHAGWNLTSKKQSPTIAFYFFANIFGGFILSPVLLFSWGRISQIPQNIWMFVVISGLSLSVYLSFLAGAYRTGDMSIAYPLTRSLPVIFVTMAVTFLGKGQEVGSWFIFGISLVVIGCFLLPIKKIYEPRFRNYLNISCFFAVMAAIGITSYTIIDSEALRCLGEIPGKSFNKIEASVIYLILQGLSSSFWMGAFIIFSPMERQSFIAVLRFSKGQVVLTSIGLYLGYGLALASMNYVTNVSYVAAFRQLSIPIGATFGMVILNEPRYMPKIIGVTAIFVGLVIAGLT